MYPPPHVLRTIHANVRHALLAYALVSSLSPATRSCGSLALLMRYSGSPLLAGSCLTTSKTPPGAFRLIAGLTITVSPILNLWDDGIGSPFRADNRGAITLIQLTGL